MDTALPEIEITDEMLTAGEQTLEASAAYFEERALASMVYTAMEEARRRSPDS